MQISPALERHRDLSILPIKFRGAGGGRNSKNIEHAPLFSHSQYNDIESNTGNG